MRNCPDVTILNHPFGQGQGGQSGRGLGPGGWVGGVGVVGVVRVREILSEILKWHRFLVTVCIFPNSV